MGKIQQANGSGKSIRVTYHLEETEEKFYICIVSDTGETISKTAQPGSKSEILFSFQDINERQRFASAYLANSKKEKAGDLFTIEEKSFIPLIYNKKILAGFFLLCLLFLVVSSCGKKGGLESLQIEQACFKNFSTVLIQGQAIFKDNTTEKQKEAILSEIKLQLMVNELPDIEKSIEENPFSLEVPFSYDPAKKYHIQGKLSGLKIPKAWKEVAFHPQFPLSRIQKAQFHKDRTLEVHIQNVFSGNTLLQVEVFPDNFPSSQAPVFSAKITSEKKEERLLLGPVHFYSNHFLLLLKSYGTVSHVLEQKKLFYPYPIAKLKNACFSTKNTILVEGEWEGNAEVVLELLEQGSSKTIEKKMPAKSFQESFSIPDISIEYEVRVICEGEILVSSFVQRSKAFVEYKNCIDKMPGLIRNLEVSLVQIWKNPGTSTQELYQIHESCYQDEMLCSRLLQESLDKPSLLSLQKFYKTLKKMSNIGIEAGNFLQKKMPETEIAFLSPKEEELCLLLEMGGKIFLEFHPDFTEAGAFSQMGRLLQEKKAKNRKKILLAYGDACSQSEQFLLGSDVYSQGILEYPEEWQFLLGRYFLYKILEMQNEYSSAGKIYQQKAMEDYKKLIRFLPMEFHKKMLDMDYSQAYITGTALLLIKPDMQEISQALEKIKISEKKENLQIPFSYKAWRKQAGKK